MSVVAAELRVRNSKLSVLPSVLSVGGTRLPRRGTMIPSRWAPLVSKVGRMLSDTIPGSTLWRSTGVPKCDEGIRQGIGEVCTKKMRNESGKFTATAQTGNPGENSNWYYFYGVSDSCTVHSIYVSRLSPCNPTARVPVRTHARAQPLRVPALATRVQSPPLGASISESSPTRNPLPATRSFP